MIRIRCLAAALIAGALLPAVAAAQPVDRETLRASRVCRIYLDDAHDHLIALGTAAQNLYVQAEPGADAWKARFDAEHDMVMRLVKEYRACLDRAEAVLAEPEPEPEAGPRGPRVILTEPSRGERDGRDRRDRGDRWDRNDRSDRNARAEQGDRRDRNARAERNDRRERGDRRSRSDKPKRRGGSSSGSNCHTNPITGKLDCGDN